MEMDDKKRATFYAVGGTTVLLSMIVMVTLQQQSNQFFSKTRFFDRRFEFANWNNSNWKKERELLDFQRPKIQTTKRSNFHLEKNRTYFSSLQRNFQFTNLTNALSKQNQSFWDSLKPGFRCPKDKLVRVGVHGDGGKWTCGLKHLVSLAEKSENFSCLVYSFGNPRMHENSSFEAVVLANTNCSVYVYEKIAHPLQISDPEVNNIEKPLASSNSSNPRVHFFKMGVGGKNTKSRKTLKTIMKENGDHKWIDILKMDADTYEYIALNKVFEDFEELPFGQLLLTFRVFWGTFKRAIKLTKGLEKRGLRMFSIENYPNNSSCCAELAFINIKALDRFLEAEEIQKNEHSLLHTSTSDPRI